MHLGIRKKIKSWLSKSSTPSTIGDVPASGAISSYPLTPLQVASALVTFAAVTFAAATSVISTAVPTAPLPTHGPSASQSTDATTPNASPPHIYTATSPLVGSSGSNPPVQSRSRASSVTAPPTPENERRALAPLNTQCGLPLAQVVDEIAPIPCIGSLAECLTLVFQAVEQSRVNKEQWKLLQGRCVMVTRVAGAQVSNYGQHHYPGLEDAAHTLEETLNKISKRAQQYNEMNEMIAFLQFQAISDEIRALFSDLDACMNLFAYSTDIAQSQWVGEFRAVQEQEVAELQRIHSLLAKMNTNLDTINQDQDQAMRMVSVLQEELVAKFNARFPLIDASLCLTKLPPQILQNQATTTPANYADAQQTVRTILALTKLQLPIELFVGQQCILDANVPIKTGITCDIYRASFLGGTKVAKKVLRIGLSNREYVQLYAERFMRIVGSWGEFRSDYTLPVYGIGIESFEGDRHFQIYMVSPLMKNLDAVTYLKQYRNTPGMKKGILRIITDTALGLQYLHNRNPPFVHSGMMGDNILITDSGGGVLGGFGLTKALRSDGHDKLPSIVANNRAYCQRWEAPELFMEDTPVPTTSSDVWGWAMTALEIVSGSIPYHTHRQALTVMLKVTTGPPRREDYIKFEDYAYRPDEMWELLEQCWTYEPEERPTIDEVVARLEQIANMQEHVKE